MSAPARVLTALAVALALSCGRAPASLGAKVNRAQLDAKTRAHQKQLVAEGDAAWAKRDDHAQVEAALARWDAAVKLDDSDAPTYAKLARGCAFLVDGTLAFDPGQAKAASATSERGIAYAEHGLLALSPAFEKAREGGTKMEEAIKLLGKDAVPLLYWYDINLGTWVKDQGLGTKMKWKDVIFDVMERVAQLDPDYFYGAADRYFGGYYAIAPSFAGGDVDKSKAHFAAALSRAPGFFANHVALAEDLATEVKDKATYVKELNFVIGAPLDGLPEVIPEQKVEKRKAAALLEKTDDHFK